MPKLNPYLVKENIAKTEEVRYLNVEIPSYEDFMKTYEPSEEIEVINEAEWQDRLLHGPQYGPSGKGGDYEIDGGQHLISSINKRTYSKKYKRDYEYYDSEGVSSIAKFGNVVASAEASAGIGGVIAQAGASYSVYREASGGCEVRFLSPAAGGEIGHGPGGTTAKVNYGVDVASIEGNGCQLRVGPNLDTGGSVGPGGVELTVAGVGVSIGKKMGVSTPLGGISVDLEEVGEKVSENCIVQ